VERVFITPCPVVAPIRLSIDSEVLRRPLHWLKKTFQNIELSEFTGTKA